MIPVTKPFFPPIEEYQKYLKGVWERQCLTNDGPLVQELEKKLAGYLDLKKGLYLSNGTIALQIAIKALGLKNEVITTPFSYVATTSAAVWEGLKPVFVDIDPGTFNIDPGKIECAITNKTTGIIATHVFGNPCDVETIEKIAAKYNLKLIYDAAHCFGTTYKSRSIYEYGDISTTSFHATKLFSTLEGGAVFTNDEELYQKMSLLRNFGHDGHDQFSGVGINGKNSELHAAMGLSVLKYADQILEKRKQQIDYYNKYLNHGLVHSQSVDSHTNWNGSFYPIVFGREEVAFRVKEYLERNEIFPRRYFYPSLNKLDYVDSGRMPISESIAERILCLPLYHDLTENEIKKISDLVNRAVSPFESYRLKKKSDVYPDVIL